MVTVGKDYQDPSKLQLKINKLISLPLRSLSVPFSSNSIAVFWIVGHDRRVSSNEFFQTHKLQTEERLRVVENR